MSDQYYHSSHYCIICGIIKSSQNEVISYHRFPKHGCDKWLEFFDLTRESLKAKLTFVTLCSRHFHHDDFKVSSNGKKWLKKGSVPSIIFISQDELCERKKKILKSSPASTCNDAISFEHFTKLENAKDLAIKKKCVLCGKVDNPRISFFQFPKDERRNEWLKACSLSHDVILNAKLCSRHFEINSFCKPPGSLTGRPVLEKTAVPTIFENNVKVKIIKEPAVHSPEYIDTSCSHEKQFRKQRICYPGDIQVKHSSLSHDVTSNAKLCSRHFEINSFCKPPGSLTGKPVLEKTAVPTIFENLVKVEIIEEPAVHSPEYIDTSCSHEKQFEKQRICYPGDIQVKHADNAALARKSISLLKLSLKKKNQTIRNLKAQIARQFKKTKNLQEALKIARKKLYERQ